MTTLKKCKGSGEVQMLDWWPDSFEDGYPGAVVCLGCSGGILIVKGTAHKATSQAGFEGMAGKVRVHYVSKDKATISYRKSRSKS